MTKRIILHIGRHKSGTTSLQRFFSHNRERLLSQGVYYPVAGVRNDGHHILAELFPMRPRNQQRARYKPEKNELVRALRGEIESAPVDTVLVSSEAFQNMAPTYAERIFAGYEVEVIVYLRDQLSYFVSSYAQKVHADNGMVDTVEDYYLKVFSGAVDYLKFLEEWEETFPGKIRVRLFERREMRNQNVVDDFCWHFLGVDVTRGYPRVEEGNPSIRGDLIEYKRILNQLLPDVLGRKTINRLYSRLPTFNERFPGSRLFITPTILKLLQVDIGGSNRQLARRFLRGVQLDERIRNTAVQHASCAELTAENFSDLYESLLPNVPGLEAALPASVAREQAGALVKAQMDWQRRRSTISLWRRYRIAMRRLRRKLIEYRRQV